MRQEEERTKSDARPTRPDMAVIISTSKRLLTCIVALLFAFFSSLAANLTDADPMPRCNQKSEQEKPSENAVRPVPDTAEKIKFRVTKMSDGRFKDGTIWTIFDLEASDGHRLYDQSARFRSRKEAHKHFQQLLKAIGKIISRNPEIDELGVGGCS